jgi:polar amino acid transport system substrate-binding protein
MPVAGQMPASSFMATLQHRGKLVAGVNQNYKLFGYLDPLTGKIDGFEIDILRQIAQAIFGTPNALQFKAMSVPERIPSVQNGSVDIVVDAVTITCARRQQVDFSTVYYDARQRLLVPSDSNARSLSDLGGKKVCATAGSVPYDLITHNPAHPIAYGVPQGSDCLVALQEGKVDAISTDDSILLGFKIQDPFVKIVGPTLADAPYGIAISQAHPEFVRFVDGVLARMRADGTWHRLYEKWLGHYVSGPAPAPPTARYDG